MRKFLRRKLICLFVTVGTVAFPGLAHAVDSLAVRIIWIENNRLYFNAGSEEGITPGWVYRLRSESDSLTGKDIIDRVYLDLCSAPADSLSFLEADSLAGLPDAFLYPPSMSRPSIAHLRVGYVAGGRDFQLPEDIPDQPLFASLFFPWTRGGSLGGLGMLSDTAGTGRSWIMTIDTLRWPGGEFPAGWGVLADRLDRLIAGKGPDGCPTPWAFRPPGGGMPTEDETYFEGFSQAGDMALGFNYASPFFTFPEYAGLGDWRRGIAAAAQYDPELAVRPPAWQRIGRQTWTCEFIPGDEIEIPFFIDTITVIPFADHDDQWLAVELGQLDIGVISIDDRLRAATHHPAYRITSAPQNALVVFGVNQRKRDLSDNLLTRAVCYLVDNESLVRALLADQAIVAHAILSEEHLPAGEPFYPLNPSRGRRLLNDFRVRRTLNFYVDERIDRGMTIARHIAGKLGAGDVNIRLVAADRRSFLDPSLRDSMDICLYYWPLEAENPDPGLYPFVSPMFWRCGSNPLFLYDRKLVDLMEQARREPDPALREQYYRQIEYDILAEPYICPLYRPIKTIVTSRQYEDIRLTGSGEIDIVTGGLNLGARETVR